MTPPPDPFRAFLREHYHSAQLNDDHDFDGGSCDYPRYFIIHSELDTLVTVNVCCPHGTSIVRILSQFSDPEVVQRAIYAHRETPEAPCDCPTESFHDARLEYLAKSWNAI